MILDVIHRNTGALRAVVDDLLDLAALESGHLSMTGGEADLAELVKVAVRAVAPVGDEFGVTVDMDLPPELIVPGDAHRLTQAIENLLSNAVKYSPHGGAVCVRLTADEDVATLTIADTGIGVPPEEQELLFQRFYRASNARHSGITGTGLGLAIVATIIEGHHGEVSLGDNHPGTLVTVRLPLRPA